MTAPKAQGAANGGAPSLVYARQRIGKNNSPQQAGLGTTRPTTKSRRVAALRRRIGPCTALPAERIRLVCLTDPSKKAPIRCKRWHHRSCQECGKWLKGRFIDVARKNCETHGLFRFLTLTLPPESRDLPVEERFKLITKVWGRFVKRVERRPTHVRRDGTAVTKKLTAVWVKEIHKDGTPHLHVAMDRYLPQKWLSEAWSAAGGGVMVDVRRASIQRMVAYVTKYLAKTLDEQVPEAASLKGIRRYGATGAANMKGVYPVKKGDEPWWIEFRQDDKTFLSSGEGWELCGIGDVSTVLAWVMSTYGAGQGLFIADEAAHRRHTERVAQLQRHRAQKRSKVTGLEEISEAERWRLAEEANRRVKEREGITW